VRPHSVLYRCTVRKLFSLEPSMASVGPVLRNPAEAELWLVEALSIPSPAPSSPPSSPSEYRAAHVAQRLATWELGSDPMPLQILSAALMAYPANTFVVEAVLDLLQQPHLPGWAASSGLQPCGESLKMLLMAASSLPALDQRLRLLSALRSIAVDEEPSYITFGGDKESFVGVLASLSLGTGLSLALWVRLDTCSATKGFLLCRCRTVEGGLDAILSDKQPGDRWTLTLRCYLERGGATEKVECKGHVTLRHGQWTHVVLTQLPPNYLGSDITSLGSGSGTGSVCVYIDGHKEVDHPFPSPFSASAGTQQVQWAIGVGLKGSVASISVYTCPLSQTLVAQLMQATVHVVCVAAAGITLPQSSFDTGYMALGTRLTKGPAAAELCRLPCPISLGPIHFFSSNTQSGGSVGANALGAGVTTSTGGGAITATLQPTALGRISGGENIEFVSSHCCDNPIVLTLAPGCGIRLRSSWQRSWMNAGGASLLLYLLDEDLVTNSSKPDADQTALSLAKAWIRLLAALISVCVDLREQLLQVHGLHMVGHSLSLRFGVKANQQDSDENDESVHANKLDTTDVGRAKDEDVKEYDKTTSPDSRDKRCILDLEMVQVCQTLLEYAACDSDRGDYTAAVLQGLFFHMGLWGGADSSVQARLLTAVMSIGDGAVIGDELRRSVGVQSLLDMLRVYFLRDPGSMPAADLSFGTVANSHASPEDFSLHPCYPIALSLLLRVYEACSDSQRVDPKATTAYIYGLLAALDLCQGAPMISLLTKILCALRRTIPTLLLQILSEHRFVDTTALYILTAGASTQTKESSYVLPATVRKDIVSLCLWIVSEPSNTLHVSNQLVSSRKKLLQLEGRRGGDLKTLQFVRTEQQALLKLMRRSWNTLSMLSEAISRSIGAAAGGESKVGGGAWGSGDTPIHAANEVLSIFFDNNAITGRFDVWLALPLLPPFLACCDLDVFQRVLMAVVVSLKTDDGQLECLCTLPDELWMPCVVRICVLGEECSARRHIDPFGPVHGAYGLGDEIGLDDSHSSKASAQSAEWHIVQAASDHSGRASTCRELALDALATLLEHKMRTQANDAWNSWMTVVALLEAEGVIIPQTNKADPNRKQGKHQSEESATTISESGQLPDDDAVMSLSAVCLRLLHRLLALVLQRLARSTEGWTQGMLPVMHSLVSLVRNAVLPVLQKQARQLNQAQNVLQRASHGSGSVCMDPVSALTSSNAEAYVEMDVVSDSEVSSQTRPTPGGGPVCVNMTHTATDAAEAQQALFFLFDCLASVRKSCEKKVLDGTASIVASAELLLIHGLRVTLSFLQVATDRSVDRMANEVVSNSLIHFVLTEVLLGAGVVNAGIFRSF
jgi:hypothetical protein